MGGWWAGATGSANREKWATFDPLPPEDRAGQDFYSGIRDEILAHADIRPGERVLDVGAGRGLLALEARRLAGPKGAVVALDLSQGALQVCRERASEGRGAVLLPVISDGTAPVVTEGDYRGVHGRAYRSLIVAMGKKSRAGWLGKRMKSDRS